MSTISESVVLVLLKSGFIKYGVEVGAAATIYIQSLIKVVSDIQKLLEGHSYCDEMPESGVEV
jgi:hypothetical protein